VTARAFRPQVDVDELADAIDGERAADGFLIAWRSGVATDGTELHSALTRLIGYGGTDRRLAGFCRRLQRALENPPR
jgi:hypothetical protein